jgi:hypothetical protein
VSSGETDEQPAAGEYAGPNVLQVNLARKLELPDLAAG